MINGKRVLVFICLKVLELIGLWLALYIPFIIGLKYGNTTWSSQLTYYVYNWLYGGLIVFGFALIGSVAIWGLVTCVKHNWKLAGKIVKRLR